LSVLFGFSPDAQTIVEYNNGGINIMNINGDIQKTYKISEFGNLECCGDIYLTNDTFVFTEYNPDGGYSDNIFQINTKSGKWFNERINMLVDSAEQLKDWFDTDQLKKKVFIWERLLVPKMHICIP